MTCFYFHYASVSLCHFGEILKAIISNMNSLVSSFESGSEFFGFGFDFADWISVQVHRVWNFKNLLDSGSSGFVIILRVWVEFLGLVGFELKGLTTGHIPPIKFKVFFNFLGSIRFWFRSSQTFWVLVCGLKSILKYTILMGFV